MKNIKTIKTKGYPVVMIKYIKLIIKYVIGFALLLVVTYYVISYAKFDFEIPFLSRNIVDIDNINGAFDDDNFAVEVTTEPPEIDNLHNIVNPDDLINRTEPADVEETDVVETSEEGEPAVEINISPFPAADELIAKGYSKSDGVYERNSYDFAQIKLEYSNLSMSQTTMTSEGRLSVIEPFMDFILIRRGNDVTLCDSSGKIITEKLTLKMLKARDRSNKSIFWQTLIETDITIDENDEEVLTTWEIQRYFIYDGDMKTFLQTDYNPIYGDRGVPFMYPSYYGANRASNMSRFENNGKWGYLVSNTEEVAIAPAYDMTYNFSENVGIAYVWEQKGNWRGYYDYKRLYFLDEQGGAYNNSYFAPNEATPDHLGFFYFDKGLTRVYYRELDYQGRVTIEKDILVDKYGREFYVPEDYAIKAYSNGVILLEKDGYYGFMSYTGNWIAQPIFTYVQPFYEGVAVIGFTNGKKGLIDTQGNIIIKFHYDYISNCTGGIVALYDRNEGWTVLNKMRRR